MTARISTTTIALAIITTLLLPLRAFADSPAPMSALQTVALKLYNSLSDDQKKQATLPLEAPERNSEVFTPGKRPGIQIRELNEEQQKQAMAMLTAFTSDYGKKKVVGISEQTPNPGEKPGFDRYYVCFFGDVAPGKTYAWRIAEHHLTLVHVEVDKGAATSFGPILLGANPPTLWDEDEDKMIALYGAMTPDEKQKSAQQGRGISTAEFKAGGVKVGDLNPSAKEAAKAVLENRLNFFSDPIHQELQSMIDQQGGLDAMQIGFWGEATKRCRDGGKWDFKLAGKSFLCDFENSRAHIHLSMKGTSGK